MEILLHWIREHGFDLLGSVGVIVSLGFTALALRREDRSRRIGNLLALTSAHREIWSQLYTRPDLARILEPKVDLARRPVSRDEELFVTFLVLHLNATWQAMKEGVFRTRQAVTRDIKQLFSLPIPKSVWRKLRELQDPDFASFVDQALQ